MTTTLDTLKARDPKFDDAVEKALSATRKLTRPGMPGAESTGGGAILSESALEDAANEIGEGRTKAVFASPEGLVVEAIVRSALRPSFFMSRDAVLTDLTGLSPVALRLMEDMDLAFSDKDLFKDNQAHIEQRALSTGRLNLFNGFREYAGTGWLVEDDIVVTNRHVANLFARRWMNNEWEFNDGQFGRPVEVRLNPLEQIDTPRDVARSASITEILWIAGSGEPDMAFLRVHGFDGTPIALSQDTPEPDQPVAVVGYPAEDLRTNPLHLVGSFFGSQFDVKRCAPGRIMNVREWELDHDASTLGGNSGSVVLDTASGMALGLHFAGAPEIRNTAVPAPVVAAALRRLGTRLAMPAIPSNLIDDTEASRADDLADREGFDRDFLGQQAPPPAFGRWEEDLAPVNGGGTELRYCHFSVWQSASRRLPLVTAVNIDGRQLRRISRKGRWRLDGRLERAHQVGNVLYKYNPLDRGHMVRRLDPCWALDQADDETILKAQADTYHYTNAAPQHKGLNQRDWVGLEDYILDSSGEFGFRVSVMTGPVLRDDDRPLKRQQGAEDLTIPREFWKVAVMAQENGKLSATGYVLSHGEMIRGLTEAEFVLGAYETYQVPLKLIEDATGLNFGALKAADPLAVDVASEAAFGQQVLRIRGTDNLLLTPR